MNIEQTKKSLGASGGLREIEHIIATFEGYRYDSEGKEQWVTVKISDRGQNQRPDFRYTCQATSEGGKKMATGNPEATVELAIMHVHWNNLD